MTVVAAFAAWREWDHSDIRHRRWRGLNWKARLRLTVVQVLAAGAVAGFWFIYLTSS